MADFASINLRKSYGQQQSLSHGNHQPFNANYGQAARGRTGSGSSTGGGMVVLSRSKTYQKASGSKLSIPPPLNLPSLRKEHERFDVSGSGGGTGTGAGTSRPTSSGVGWSKPAPAPLQDKDGSVHGNSVEQIAERDNNRTNGSYLSSSARSAAPVGHVSGSARVFSSSVEKASVLWGEDFPSLHSALPVSSTGQKQKDGLVQKQRQAVGEDSSYVTRDGSQTSALVDMHSQVQSLRQTARNGLVESSTETHLLGKSPVYDQSRKSEEYFPGPLPLVRLNPRSDWADDERDTRHGLPDRGRDTIFAKGDDYWDRDFDLPRASVLPTKYVYKQYEKQGLRDNESGKGFSSAVLKVDPESRKMTDSREGRENNNWRSTSHLKGQEVASDRNGTVGARGSGFNKDTWKDTRYTPPHADNADQYSGVGGTKDSTSVWKDRYSKLEPFNGRVTEHNTRDRYSIEQSGRYGGDTSSKSSFTSRGKMAYMPDPLQDKSTFSKGERVIVEDGFHKEFSSSTFDDMDPFYVGWPGVIKRKKDMKPTDFVDPVRESFEAELERVQRMQELERQRLIDEQERATEEARREEEERQRLIREEEERQRRLEEEAREAAWREERERLEATQRAEEQRIAREVEKRRVFTEEERRKQAAKQKLLELEAKMAKRQTGSSKADSSIDSATIDEKLRSLVIDKENSSTVGFDNWEESERMVERITTFPIESSSSSNRDFDINMKPYFGREGPSSIPDRSKSINSWRRDVFGNGSGSSSSLQEQEMGHYSPRGDTFVGGRVGPRKDFNGGARSRGYLRGDMQEHFMDEFGHQRDQRWNFPADADIYRKNPELDYEFSDNFANKYGDGGRAQGRYQGNHHHVYPNAESDEIYSYGRSRYAMRQPRVLPPPSLASAHRTPFGGLDEHPSSSTFLANSHHHHATRSESSRRMGYYGSYGDGFETSDPLDVRPENPESENRRRNEEVAPRCDSQSSLSVTSPPNSAPHLSHDELDESGSSPITSPGVHEGKVQITRNESSDSTIAMIDAMVNAPSCASVEVDNWTIEDHDTLLHQEEYDEHGGGYQEEYEVNEGEDENLDINQEFEDLHLEERESSDTVDNLVLGFDDGVQVQLSSVDFQKDSRREEIDFGESDAAKNIVEDRGSLKPVEGEVQILHPMDGSQITVDNPSGSTVHESDKAMLDPIQQTTDLPIDIDVSSNYGLSAQKTASPVTEAICSTQPTTASSSSQPDVPVRLQFGLFSGPSLIPSPVPAIQIGSIQMPLHLYPPVGPSVTTHIHPPQSPIFQFGQFPYTSPMSQGLLPMPPMPVPFVRPNVQSHYVQPAQDTTCQTAMQEEVKSHSKFASGSRHQSRDSFLANNFVEDGAPVKTQDAEIPQVPCDKISLGFSSKDKHEGQIGEPIQPPNQLFSGAKKIGGVRNSGAPTNNRGRRFAYAIKSSNTGTNFPANASPQDSGGFQRRPRRFVQRTEFRVRENGDKRHYSGNVSTNNSRLDEKSNYNGRNREVFERSVSRQGNMHRKPLKRNDLDNLVSANGINPGNRKNMENGKHASTRADIPSHSMDETLKRNMSEEDFGDPLQSGVVRVFNQPGIEAASDEDDFIQVRSKRQMLNDRREQRQKEIKAKYRDTKPPKKSRASKQSTAVPASVQKTSVVNAATPKLLDVASEGHGMPNGEVTAGMLLVTSQPLPPIGAPSKNCEPQTDTKSQAHKSSPTSRSSIVSLSGSNLVSSAISGIKNKFIDDVSRSLTSWGATQTTQQVTSLTQTQLEESMKPVCFDTHIASIGGHSSSTIAEATPSSSILIKDKSFSSSSPINSLLAGEKIQFGAVTSTAILPLSSHPASHGIGILGSIPTDMHSLQKVSTSESGIFFERDKNTGSCSLHDCDPEAEAAASAVAVAAIGGDETVGSRIGSVSVSDAKDFDGKVDENSEVMASDQQLSNKSRGEDSLTVSLPADLSVETPTISMWQSLPSPQSSTSQVLSHFPGAPPSHFPFYEVNPMLGRPVFALQHEASTGNQSQPQTDTPSISGPFSSWQHSAVDSFYGRPAGYPGPFISPPGGISGVQGSPHMVVYNHFAPVGQFGQVGLSFMGTTYIPTGKQPDWKHNPTSSANGIGEAEINSRNMVSSQHSNSNHASTIQHLSPGPPLMPMASPLTMFDAPPFQSQEVSAQAHWSSVPASNLNSIPASQALQQQVDGILPSQFGHGRPVGQSLNANKFLDTETSVSCNSPSLSMAEGTSVTQFTDKLRLVDSSLSNVTGTSSQNSSRDAAAVDVDKRDGIRNVTGSNKPNVSARPQSSLQHRNASAQQVHTAGYTYQRGAGMSQRNTSGSEWSHRRMGYNGKNQSQGAEKGFPAAKVKQIYVAKQTMSGAPSAG